jgi:hypothetical protein
MKTPAPRRAGTTTTSERIARSLKKLERDPDAMLLVVHLAEKLASRSRLRRR